MFVPFHVDRGVWVQSFTHAALPGDGEEWDTTLDRAVCKQPKGTRWKLRDTEDCTFVSVHLDGHQAAAMSLKMKLSVTKERYPIMKVPSIGPTCWRAWDQKAAACHVTYGHLLRSHSDGMRPPWSIPQNRTILPRRDGVTVLCSHC